MQKKPLHILPLIVLSQFAGTSLWFVGNAVLPELKESLQLSQYAVSHVTSAVMIGFIVGTLVFALFALADRFSPVRLFFTSSLLGALFNLSVAWWATDGTSLFILRFLTGFCLAGIYPVGMKIAADWYDKGLGKALGYLVGALVLGTAFPHLLKNKDFEIPWKTVLYCTSAFALAGGLLMVLFVGDGPYRKQSGRFEWNAIPTIFRSRNWRQAAFGYFGHMWEIYSFWGFLPVILATYVARNNVSLNIPLISFIIIGVGGLSCIIGGYLSQRWGSARIAFASLCISCACCLLSPFAFSFSATAFLFVLFIWGLTVASDSPQFSTLVSKYAPDQLRGTALTIYNSIGFLITVISLQLIDRVFHSSSALGGINTFALLAIGPILGLVSFFSMAQKSLRNNSV